MFTTKLRDRNVASAGKTISTGTFIGGMMGWPSSLTKFMDRLVRPLLGAVKGDADGDGALGVLGGKLRGKDRVERAQQIELAVVIGCRVAENSHLDCHNG